MTAKLISIILLAFLCGCASPNYICKKQFPNIRCPKPKDFDDKKYSGWGCNGGTYSKEDLPYICKPE